MSEVVDGGDEWRVDAVSRIEAAAVALASAHVDRFDAVLEGELAAIARVLGLSQLAEWTDDIRDAQGPYSPWPANTPGLVVVPCRVGKPCRSLAVVAGDASGADPECLRTVGLLAPIVGSARLRVEAMRALESQMEETSPLTETARNPDTDRFLREVATLVSQTRHDSETELIEGVLASAVGHFGAEEASIWRREAYGYRFRRDWFRRADRGLSVSPEVVDGHQLHINGAAPSGNRPSEPSLEPHSMPLCSAGQDALVVSLGGLDPAAGRLVLIGGPGWSWDESTVNACRTLGALVQQGLARFEAERQVAYQLRLSQLSERVAGLAVEVTPATVGDVLLTILRDCVEFFDLSAAQAWSVVDGKATMRRIYRPDGRAPRGDFEMDVPAGAFGGSRGWVSTRLEQSANLYEGEYSDPSDSRVMVSSFAVSNAASHERFGFLAFVDPRARSWVGDEIDAIRSISDTVGQLLAQVRIGRVLERQRQLETLLSDAAQSFVHSARGSARGAVEAVLERMRVHLDADSVALFELNLCSAALKCRVEVSLDGRPLQAGISPIPSEHPVLRKVIDNPKQTTRELNSLINPGLEADDREILTVPVVNGRDLIVLSAVSQVGRKFLPDAEAGVRSLASLLAQLRARLLLERSTALRADADRMLGQIAADFVERTREGAAAASQGAVERIGELFSLEAVTLWRGTGKGCLERAAAWSSGGIVSGIEKDLLESDDPVLQDVREAGFGVVAVVVPGEGRDRTLTFAPIVKDGILVGGISAVGSRPTELTGEGEVLRGLLDAVAHLVRQFWERREADAAIDRRLMSEDLLRQFATRLVTATSTEGSVAEEAFGWLLSQFGVVHGSFWRKTYGNRPTIELRMQFPADRALLVKPDRSVYAIEPRNRFDQLIDSDGAEWSIDEDHPIPAQVRRMVGVTEGHRVRVIGDSEGARLLYLLPGDDPIPGHVRTTLHSALSILAQHDARMAAERALSAAFSSAPIAICLRDGQTNLLSCNQAYVELLGRTEEEMQGLPLETVVSAEHAADAVSDLEGLDLGQQVVREMAYRRPNGGVVWARVRSTPVEIPGRGDGVYFMYSEDITDRRRHRQLLEYQAAHDDLTGLPNRRSFVEGVERALDSGGGMAVLILDLDRFKLVNDSLGHPAGDRLLVACADRIRMSLRPSDLVCRLGGDEFAVLLGEPADTAAAAAVADRLLDLLREPVQIGDEEVFPAASIGIAVPTGSDGVDDLMRHADAAMYEAKGQGRNRSVLFDRSMRDAVVQRVRTENELRRAIENGQLEVHYQPEFMLDSSEIVGVEALVRWRHPVRGLLNASDFITLAEESGLVVEIGRWVLGEATRQAAEWERRGSSIVVRVNLSARQLRTAIVDEVRSALQLAQLDPRRLCLEITETAIMDDVQESTRILHEFRDLGVSVAVDDFGTGFSSLGYLKRFPVDILKIDRTFVAGVGIDADDTAIVQSIVALARTLRLDVVAEGIEDPAQAAELVRLGCLRGQGFYLAEPGPADVVGKLFVRA